MSLKFIQKWRDSSDERVREGCLKRFRLHAGEIHEYFKEADLDSEFDDVVTRLNILVGGQKLTFRSRSARREKISTPRPTLRSFGDTLPNLSTKGCST